MGKEICYNSHYGLVHKRVFPFGVRFINQI